MQRVCVILAFAAVVAAGFPLPGQYLAIGLGIAAIGTGRIVFRRTSLPGLSRLAGAAAMTIGGLGLGLGIARVAMTLVAIGHLERLLG